MFCHLSSSDTNKNMLCVNEIESDNMNKIILHVALTQCDLCCGANFNNNFPFN